MRPIGRNICIAYTTHTATRHNIQVAVEQREKTENKNKNKSKNHIIKHQTKYFRIRFCSVQFYYYCWMLDDEMLERFVMMNANTEYTLVLDVVKWPCFVIFPFSFESNYSNNSHSLIQMCKMFRAKNLLHRTDARTNFTMVIVDGASCSGLRVHYVKYTVCSVQCALYSQNAIDFQ